MHRKFITLILSAAVAVAGFGAPARADGQDIAKALIGFTALALIAKAIDDKNDRAAPHYPAPPVYSHPGRPPIYGQPGRPPIYGQPGRPPIYSYPTHPTPPRPLPPQVSRFDLPQSCLRNFRVDGRTVQLFGHACMNNTYAYANSLPYACQYGFNNDRGRTRIGYEPLCLRQKGYRTARF